MEKYIQAHLIGINTEHSPHFGIDRDCDPYNTNLILCFRSPAIILTEAGIQTARIGDCIVHQPTFPQYHCSMPDAAEGYRNDWLHVSPSPLTPIMKRLGLPYNTLISTGQPEVLTAFIQRIQEELMSLDDFSERILANLLEGMLLTVAKYQTIMNRQQRRMTNSEQRHFPEFVALRRKLLENCSRETTVEKLAANVNLSPERFAVLYRKFFKKTPYADLIDARLIKAKRLLLSTAMGIKEIATACGWENLHYFSRLFKQKIGVPASKYRTDSVPPPKP